ncbi:MAG: hypothetical protein J1E83_00755 [Lachnospiraceae bacterium]|nr:hypothetical protein [Lachnospiraceae bacterium]
MDFINKVEKTVTAKGQILADKAKEVAEIASLRSQIGTCEEIIKKNYAEIGRLYYETFGEEPQEPFLKQCRAIQNAKKGVQELEQKIKDIKGV